MPDWVWVLVIAAAFLTVNRAHLLVLIIRRRIGEAEGMRLVADFERKLPRRTSVSVTGLMRLLTDSLTRRR